MSFGGVKRDKHDIIFSDLVRMRVNWSCEVCGKFFPEGTRQGLHCSHLFGRRYRGTRWCPDNAFSMCFRCHQTLGENPVDFHIWARQRLGDGLIDILREKSQRVTKLKKNDLEAMHKHYKDEFKRIEILRKLGETGRLEFAGFL